MGICDMMLQYCDTNLMHVYKTKPVKVVDANENGLNFTPLCDGICFWRKVECDHGKKNLQINNVGHYVQIPSKWYHEGYFNDVIGKVFVTAQLFERPSTSIEGAVSMLASYNNQIIERQAQNVLCECLSWR